MGVSDIISYLSSFHRLKKFYFGYSHTMMNYINLALVGSIVTCTKVTCWADARLSSASTENYIQFPTVQFLAEGSEAYVFPDIDESSVLPNRHTNAIKEILVFTPNIQSDANGGGKFDNDLAAKLFQVVHYENTKTQGGVGLATTTKANWYISQPAIPVDVEYQTPIGTSSVCVTDSLPSTESSEEQSKASTQRPGSNYSQAPSDEDAATTGSKDSPPSIAPSEEYEFLESQIDKILTVVEDFIELDKFNANQSGRANLRERIPSSTRQQLRTHIEDIIRSRRSSGGSSMSSSPRSSGGSSMSSPPRSYSGGQYRNVDPATREARRSQLLERIRQYQNSRNMHSMGQPDAESAENCDEVQAKNDVPNEEGYDNEETQKSY